MISTLSMFVSDSARYRCVYVGQSADRSENRSGSHGDPRPVDDSLIMADFSPELDVQGFVVNVSLSICPYICSYVCLSLQLLVHGRVKLGLKLGKLASLKVTMSDG